MSLPAALASLRFARHRSHSQEPPSPRNTCQWQSSQTKASKESAPAIHVHEKAIPVAPESASKESSKLNKSEEIRKRAKELQERGEKPRPGTIVNTLKAREGVVSSPQVSVVLKKQGVERRPTKMKSAALIASSNGFSSAESFTVHQLLAAKRFVEMIGSPKRAMALLNALDKIS